MGQIGDAPLLKLLGKPCPPVTRQAITKSSSSRFLRFFFHRFHLLLSLLALHFFDTTRSFSLPHIGMPIILVHLRCLRFDFVYTVRNERDVGI